MKFVTVIVAALLLAGCFPVYKTLQPSANATVVDELGKPIPEAKVVLIASSYPYGRERFRHQKNTWSNGEAEFPSIREWRIESLMIHGVEFFFWNWCVEKDGFITTYTSHRSDNDFDRNPQFVLKPGQSESCANK